MDWINWLKRQWRPLGGLMLVLALGVLIPSTPALSQESPPSMPDEFWGKVYIGSSLASAGTRVEAWIGETKKAETTVQSGGDYSIQVPGSSGQWIRFKVGNQWAQEMVPWDGVPERLDLHVTADGGGGGGVTLTVTCPTGSGTVGTSYSSNIGASGGTPPYSCSIISGSLPPGLNRNNCAISGVPTTAGTYNFTVQVTDSASPANSGTGSCSITISPAGQPGQPLDIVTACPLPGARVNTQYSCCLQATGGTPPYTWSLASGTLPANLTLNSSTGCISGVPNRAGSYSFTIRVADSASPPASKLKACSIAVSTGPPAPAFQAPAITVTLSWSTIQGATRYQLQVSSLPTFAQGYDLFNQDVGNVTTYQVTLPQQGLGLFYWRVRAGDATSWGDWSRYGMIYWRQL